MSENGNPKGQLDPDHRNMVLRALEDPNYEWRTVEGVAEQTGLPHPTCVRFLTN